MPTYEAMIGGAIVLRSGLDEALALLFASVLRLNFKAAIAIWFSLEDHTLRRKLLRAGVANSDMAERLQVLNVRKDISWLIHEADQLERTWKVLCNIPRSLQTINPWHARHDSFFADKSFFIGRFYGMGDEWLERAFGDYEHRARSLRLFAAAAKEWLCSQNDDAGWPQRPVLCNLP